MQKSALLQLFLFFLLTQPAFGQHAEATAAEQFQPDLKLAEQVLADADELTLPENRAVVFAKVGGFLCATDQKRAHTLFHKSIFHLIVAQQQAAGIRKNANNFEQLIYGQMPRQQILTTVAACDLELAIELLHKSRPAKISQLMVPESRSARSNLRYYVSSELAAEQRFISLAADQNPARAIELLRGSLKNGVAYETISLLQKILQKDEKAAGELTEKVGQKLVETKLTADDYQAVLTVQYFLSEFGKEKPPDVKSLAVSESLVRKLADKLSLFLLANIEFVYNIDVQILDATEKYFPVRVAEIKEKRAQNSNFQEYNRYLKLTESNASPEEILKQASGFKIYRTAVYYTAIRKFAESGHLEQATSLINSTFSEEEAQAQLSSLFYNLASVENYKGNFDEAKRLIAQIPDDGTRFRALLELARRIYETTGEDDKRSALSVLDKAQAMIDTSDISEQEITSLIEISDVYSTIEPAQAFRTLEMIIPRLNDFFRNYAVVSQYRNEQLQRNGEFLISATEDFSGTYNLSGVLQNLEGTDFDRTMQLVNGFERAEIRIGLKLELINDGTDFELD